MTTNAHAAPDLLGDLLFPMTQDEIFAERAKLTRVMFDRKTLRDAQQAAMARFHQLEEQIRLQEERLRQAAPRNDLL